MISKSVLFLMGLCLLSCSTGARKEVMASGAAMPIDTSTTAVLPLEVYGRYYKLQDVVRQDASFRPIPRPADANYGLWDGGYPYDRHYDIRHVMFTPGMSHIDYLVPDIEAARVRATTLPHPLGTPPAYFEAWRKKDNMLLFVSDTTSIHPTDGLITTSRKSWHENLERHERLATTFHLLHADTGRLVIRVDYHRGALPTDYAHPHYEEMHYCHVPQDSVLAGRRVLFFPSHMAADDYLIPTDSLSFHDLKMLRYPPMRLRPDTLRVDAEGGTFPVEPTLHVMGAYVAIYGLSSYEGSAKTDTISGKDIGRQRSWIHCFFDVEKTQFDVKVLPNVDTRSRCMRLVVAGDTFDHLYRTSRRTPPSATLVILQEGAQGDPSTSAK